jgi:hypothetical protein
LKVFALIVEVVAIVSLPKLKVFDAEVIVPELPLIVIA